MSKLRSLIKSELFIAIFLLVAVSAIAYLPFIAHFSYFNDDWYEMFATGTRGPLIFIDIFSVDRPARALLMIPLYILFGRNPFPYNVTAYLFRLFSGLSVLWSLRMVWPQQKRLATLAALFYLIYPGFLSQPNAIDFQSHIAGLCFATFSIALTLKAVTTKNLWPRIFISGLSIFFGLAYLSQMEYYAGYEVVRFVLLFILAGQTEKTFFARLKRAVLWYLPFIVVPLLFFTWRLFFFQDIRKQTDIGTQLGGLITAPRHTILVWTATLIQSMADVIVLAWFVPFYSAFSSLSAIDEFVGLGVALIADPDRMDFTANHLLGFRIGRWLATGKLMGRVGHRCRRIDPNHCCQSRRGFWRSFPLFRDQHVWRGDDACSLYGSVKEF